MSQKYIYQKFLLQCDYANIDLNSLDHFNGNINHIMRYGTDYCLFDLDGKIIRKISLTDIDKMIDTENDWNMFSDSLKNIDELIICGMELEQYDNPILKNYRIATLKAYIYRLLKTNTKIYFNFDTN
jgi:hypothetical protein